MNVVWSIECINSDPYLSEAEIATLDVSVYLWKKYNPQDTLILYADQRWKEYLQDKKLLTNFDIINTELFNKRKSGINKSVFWASGKIEALQHTKAPCVHVDNDFYANISLQKAGLFNNDVAVCYEELTKGYYLEPIKALKGIEKKRLKGIAFNTCILYFKDEKVKDRFCMKALDYMKKVQVDDRVFQENKSLYMIFAEQQLLGEYVAENNLTVSAVIGQVWDSVKGGFVEQQSSICKKALFSKEKQAFGIICHLGAFKTVFKNDMAKGKDFAEKVIQYFKK